jgi:hypothetical protein
MPFNDIDALIGDPDASHLLMALRRYHGPDAVFALGKAMARKLGWGDRRFRIARAKLAKIGRLHCICEGGRGPNDPPLYGFGAKGIILIPNPNRHPLRLSPLSEESQTDLSEESLNDLSEESQRAAISKSERRLLGADPFPDETPPFPDDAPPPAPPPDPLHWSWRNYRHDTDDPNDGRPAAVRRRPR